MIADSPPAKTPHPDWLLWQLADSAFPTGGFAHSGGLEASWQHGEIRNRTDLASFLDASLLQVGHAALPLVNAAHLEPERIVELDQLCDAFTPNHVANRASRLQGRALLMGAEKAFEPVPGNHRNTSAPKEESTLGGEGLPLGPPFAHLAPIFGAVTRRLNGPRADAMRLFLFMHGRSLVASAVRLNIVGPMEGQAIQFRLSSQAEAVARRATRLTLDDLAQTAPLLEVWQGAQDRLYSRLFQS